MFFSVFILCAFAIIYTAARRGPRDAVIMALALAMIVPNWLVREVGAVLVDMRLSCALLGIGCAAFHPQTRWRLQLIAADYVVAALIATQFVTELTTSTPVATSLAEIAVQWSIPYILGRLAWRSAADGERLLPAAAVCCLVLGGWSAIESVTRINPVSAALGYAGSLQGQHDIRWGLKRADGPLMHPIFFGLQMVLLLPLGLEAARRAKLGMGPRWWRFAPWAAAAGAFFSMSRGPQIGLAIVGVAALFALVPRHRIAIAVPVVLGVGFIASMPDVAVDLLHRWSGEQPTTSIQVRGDQLPYSGTMHRILQVYVYEDSLRHAGPLGYGTSAFIGPQARIPHVEEHLRSMFASIDNHYLQFTLHYGYFGVGLFLLLCVLGAAYAAAEVRRGGDYPWLAAGTAGAIAALTLLLTTVWLASDIRFPLLVVVGLAGGMRASAVAPVASAFTRPQGPVLRLSPGHPQWQLC